MDSNLTLEDDHVKSIKAVWDKFPQGVPFSYTLKDSNHSYIAGLVYGDAQYGAVLYLAFNGCGIVSRRNGIYSDIQLSQ